jgi:6-phosphogluconolactonase
MANELLVFVGALNREAPYFQGARGVGLSVYSFNEETRAIEKLAETGEVDNPTYLSVNADGTRIYANSEVFAWREGTVTAYAFDREAKTLSYINKQPTLGAITAHNSITRDGTKLLVANYGMGSGGPDQSVVVYGIREDGGLTPPLDSIDHEGTGPNAERQERAHAHSVTPSISGQTAIVADLGIDCMVSYRVEADGMLEPLAETVLKPGAGPRHVALHPGGKFVFVMNELDSTVVSLALDETTGAFSYMDALPAVPSDARGTNHCADIQISPDGRFLYGSNRGHDSISIFEVDQQTGKLTGVGYTKCGGATPRNLALTPSGSHLFSANQNADRITIFQRDPETGLLADTGKAIETGTPMCVKIVS